ncbi:hypothetical protein BCR34DRAFT_483610 [Clohesyomyces aquaticus]|uniref:Ent-kaurene synthase n=1 Tax=Clohesyomyces aquaticus TaxID=1231657 RepID=A0A1Y1ZNM0_9PLEO|nr:hypothetical protein BCR34DRAFT_483610 [Clohesyomyces aquaticus]
MTPELLETTASNLIRSLSIGLQGPNGLGSFSPSVYDTAWLSMVARNGDFIFPQCFQYLLDTQKEDGSWQSYATPLDGILNTMIGLVALLTKSKSLQVPDLTLISRASRAEAALREMVQDWEISSCDQVGFEIIVPALLRLLEAQGIKIEFPGRDVLLKMAACKMSKLKPLLSGNTPSTLLHSLESFAGILDYSAAKHHRSTYGAMLASPASTAAYLMYAPEWDDKAEQYLRSVVESGTVAGEKSGGVPSAFPTSIFEITWTVCSLLDSGYTIQDLGEEALSSLADDLERQFLAEGSLAGFAPECVPDADDTAMTISTLGRLGRTVSVDRMFSEFECPTHFRTYRGERNASFSPNCNVLLCLLQRRDSFENTSQIVKCAQYLADCWYTNATKDKWNVSAHYTMMLLSKALTLFLSRWESDLLNNSKIPPLLVQQQIPVILLDMALRTLDGQADDGSWDHKHEVTAYAMLTLSSLLRLPWLSSQAPEILARLVKGQEYLHRRRADWTQGAYLWIEKVAYSSSNLSLAYCLSAIKISPTKICPLGPKTSGLLSLSPKRLADFTSFFSRLPPFASHPAYKIPIQLLQASLFVPELAHHRHDIFSRKNVSEDKYLQYIPFTWIASSDGGRKLDLKTQWEMMKFSLLMYQIDEFMESVVGGEAMVEDLESATKTLKNSNGTMTPVSPNAGTHSPSRLTPLSSPPTSNPHNEILTTLQTFKSHILTSSSLLRSPPWLPLWLRQELSTFLLSHISQLEASRSHSPSPTKPQPSTYTTFLHLTSAPSTSCPFSFPYYLSLLPSPQTTPLASGLPRYLAQSLISHLANMCRQHNDIGSLARDRDEGNLNSVDFAEVGGKGELLRMAEYERMCLEGAFAELGRVVGYGKGGIGEEVMRKLRVFVDVTDLYGHIYLARDIGVTVKGQGQS